MSTVPKRPPVDAELAASLALIEMDGSFCVSLETLSQIREGIALAGMPREALEVDGAVALSEHDVPVQDGAVISVLVLRPKSVRGPVAGIYHTHGGGMIMGDSRTGLEVPLQWALDIGAVVVSVEYRLAPEFPDPIPVEDCYAGLAWTFEHADELGIDPGRMVVSGASAGGGLAVGLALMARDRLGPRLIGQILMAPMLDDRNETVSSYEWIGQGFWDRNANEVGWGALLGDRKGGPDVSPYTAPGRATDLSDLPSAYIDVGSAEIFRDEAVDYALRLWRSGTQAELHVWPGACHGFESFAPHAALSVASAQARTAWVSRLLSQGGLG